MMNSLDLMVSSCVGFFVKGLTFTISRKNVLWRFVLGGAVFVATACGGASKNKPPQYGSSVQQKPGAQPMISEPNDGVPVTGLDVPEVGSANSDTADYTPAGIGPPGLDMSPEEKQVKVQKHLQNAETAVQSGAGAEQVVREAKAALQIDETSVDAMVLLAHGNVIKGFYDMAEDVLSKAFERGGNNNKKAFFLLGLIYEKTERLDKAPVAYQNALTLDPNYQSALINLGVSHLRSKRYQDAVAIFERLTGNLGVNEASVWTNLGSGYRGLSAEFMTVDINRRNELINRAAESYKKAISRDGNYPSVYYNMGLLYLDADPFPTAEGPMDRVLRLKSAKTYLDEYRRLPGADQKLVDQTTAVAIKLLDKEERLRKKLAEREAKRAELEKKRKQREENGGGDELDEEGFE